MSRIFLLLITLLASLPASAVDGRDTWYGEEGEIRLHFFWSKQCPHCLEALPFLERIAAERPWLELHSYQLVGEPENLLLYRSMAAALGEQARAVPGFLFCGRMVVGYDNAEGIGADLLRGLEACHAGEATAAEETPLRLPLIGEVEVARWSLPLLTVVIAGLDAFNPCAFFVLLFLLSLLVHLKSRRRMALVGGIFVLTSGVAYFLFMAAWLNLFLLIGELRLVTLAAGAVALAVGAVNIKDFYRPGQGVTLSMSDANKQRLFQRVRGLMATARWPATVAATLVLAVAANGYELLCTAGFPMAYTRILTLHGLEPLGYYLYLGLYNLVYMTPLALIVVLFTWRLGARKLSEREGRILKLASGAMMLALGSALLSAPQMLTSPIGALILLILALIATAVLARLERR